MVVIAVNQNHLKVCLAEFICQLQATKTAAYDYYTLLVRLRYVETHKYTYFRRIALRLSYLLNIAKLSTTAECAKKSYDYLTFTNTTLHRKTKFETMTLQSLYKTSLPVHPNMRITYSDLLPHGAPRRKKKRPHPHRGAVANLFMYELFPSVRPGFLLHMVHHSIVIRNFVRCPYFL